MGQEPPERVHVTVSGVVQGVGFREWTARAARAAGVAGWVRNRPDGRVEAVLEGPPGGLEEVLAAVRRGPPAAVVDALERVEESPRGLTGFEVRA
jgi:acylphosphatase